MNSKPIRNGTTRDGRKKFRWIDAGPVVLHLTERTFDYPVIVCADQIYRPPQNWIFT